MNVTIPPTPLKGRICAPASKSYAHRALICAALSDRDTEILCGPVCDDIEATIDCLTALGATIRRTARGFTVRPITAPPDTAVLPCRESGATLRFLLPVAGALGIEATFVMEGRLPQRPVSPLWELMQEMGCRLSRPDARTILCRGKLRSGQYSIDATVSSQFITGLQLALQRLPGSSLTLRGPVVSAPYLELTQAVIALFPAQMPIAIEADWSGASYFLAANALGSHIEISGLDPNSCQGDKAIIPLLQRLKENDTISAKDIPDLVPTLAVFASFHRGAVFTDISRLRQKESDRVQAIVDLLQALGGKAYAEGDRLTVCPVPLIGGTVDSRHDHRIAMAAAVAATRCTAPVTILGAQCVSKSYPQFWEDYERLGGKLCASTASI